MLSNCVGYWVRRLCVPAAFRRLCAPAALSLLAVGCVPYAVHQQTKEELIKAKDANADLIKRYNSALMALKNPERGAGVMPADYEKLLRENEDLKAKVAGKLGPGFTPGEIAEVGGDDEDNGIAIGEALLFGEGSADLKREAYPLLDRLVAVLVKEHSSEPFIIEGHTDNQPLLKTAGKFGDNLTLGYARAHAVGSYLMSKGIPESRMIATSYSFNKPLKIDTVNSREGRRQNRRVVVRLTTLKL